MKFLKLIRKQSVLWFLLFTIHHVFADATMDNASPTASELVNALQGPGVVVTNPSRPNSADSTSQYGIFSNGISGAGLNIDSGIILSTGTALEAITSNDSVAKSEDVSTASYSDVDLIQLPDSASATEDVAILEFDVTTEADIDNVVITYQFGSEEYPQYTCSTYNDSFAFFVTGPGISGVKNIATLPVSNLPVSINTINNASPGFCGNPDASSYYIDNSSNAVTTEYNGLTKMLLGRLEGLLPNTTYHFKLVIADTSDSSYDSGVFITQLFGFSSDSDNDGIKDKDDKDDDDDGIDDLLETGGFEPNGDEDGDGIENWLDGIDNNGRGDGTPTDYTDANNDGLPDVYYFNDGDSIPNHLDLDSDGDGCSDVKEAGFSDADSDGVLGTSPIVTNSDGRVVGQGGYVTPADYFSDNIADYLQVGGSPVCDVPSFVSPSAVPAASWWSLLMLAGMVALLSNYIGKRKK